MGIGISASRSVAKVRDQVLLAGACQNMEKMARLLARHPPCSGSNLAVQEPPGYSTKSVIATVGISVRQSEIRKRQTPPSEKDGVCQKPERA